MYLLTAVEPLPPTDENDVDAWSRWFCDRSCRNQSVSQSIAMRMILCACTHMCARETGATVAKYLRSHAGSWQIYGRFPVWILLWRAKLDDYATLAKAIQFWYSKHLHRKMPCGSPHDRRHEVFLQYVSGNAQSTHCVG